MMNKSFSENTMEIINAIKEYRDKHGDDGIVEKYYEEHGTYTELISPNTSTTSPLG